MTVLAILAGVASLILARGFIEDMYFQLGEALIHSQSGHAQAAKKGFFSYGSRSPERYLMEDNRADLLAISTLPRLRMSCRGSAFQRS
jgi:putative ABC transport system permease protein